VAAILVFFARKQGLKADFWTDFVQYWMGHAGSRKQDNKNNNLLIMINSCGAAVHIID